MKTENEARRSSPTCVEPLERLKLCGSCRHAPEVDGLHLCSRLVAVSPVMHAVIARASVVAATSSNVVIGGETGTGKEVMAKLIHTNSERKNKPFVAINVSALPAELLESELFGHVKGAFTGAVATTPGLFGEADGGTLLLDEIGEMPLPLQAKLLRVLQEGEVRRVGETRARPVNVRVISATHRDLKALVAEGRFRQDLYYRLKVFSLVVPPLRERPEDVVPLAHMFGRRLGAPLLRLSPSARGALERYAWPGNVRELGNVVEHALAYARGGIIERDHLPDELADDAIAAPAAGLARERGARLVSLAEVERDHIAHVMSACGDNQVEAAKVLGISRSTLWRKLARDN